MAVLIAMLQEGSCRQIREATPLCIRSTWTLRTTGYHDLQTLDSFTRNVEQAEQSKAMEEETILGVKD